MPRRPRGWIDHACYHITHRCHGRKFLFRFAKYRDYYVHQLYETSRRFRIDVLDYMVTSNHVHLLLTAEQSNEISPALQYLHGTMGQRYNLQRHDEGAFWSNRFHSTMIQTDDHFSRCLFYVDLNMVRAGVVKHPSEWKHGSHAEFTGTRKRYRIINIDRLLECLWMSSEKEFRQWYLQTLAETLSLKQQPEPFWSQAVAVGSPEWLEGEAPQLGLKRFKVEAIGQNHYLMGKGPKSG